MGILGIDHINIDTTSLDDTVAFYEGIFGLESRPKPSGKPGAWLHLGDQALIHVNIVDGDAQQPTGLFNHVAFMGENRDAMAVRLDSAGIEYELHERPEMNRSQLFVHDPNGILLEITFQH